MLQRLLARLTITKQLLDTDILPLRLMPGPAGSSPPSSARRACSALLRSRSRPTTASLPFNEVGTNVPLLFQLRSRLPQRVDVLLQRRQRAQLQFDCLLVRCNHLVQILYLSRRASYCVSRLRLYSSEICVTFPVQLLILLLFQAESEFSSRRRELRSDSSCSRSDRVSARNTWPG